MILQDGRVKVSVIAHEFGISAGTVSNIIHSVLMMSRVSSRWVHEPSEQKACCQQFSEENLDMLRANPENYFSRIITEDETWVHHHDPETKQESMQWKYKGSPTPKIFCVQQSARISNRKAVKSCRLVSFYFVTTHPHSSYAHRGLLHSR